MEEIKTIFSFKETYDETTNEMLPISFTLKWKKVQEEQLQLWCGGSALGRPFTFAALRFTWLFGNMFKSYWVFMQSCIRI